MHQIFSLYNIPSFGSLNMGEFFFCSGHVHVFFLQVCLQDIFLQTHPSPLKSQMIQTLNIL